MNILGVIAYPVVVSVGLMQRELEEQFSFMLPLMTFGFRWTFNGYILSLSTFFSSSFSHYSCSDKIFSILPNCIWQEIEKQLQSITPPSVMDVPLRCNFAVAQLRKVQGELSYHL